MVRTPNLDDDLDSGIDFSIGSGGDEGDGDGDFDVPEFLR